MRRERVWMLEVMCFHETIVEDCFSLRLGFRGLSERASEKSLTRLTHPAKQLQLLTTPPFALTRSLSLFPSLGFCSFLILSVSLPSLLTSDSIFLCESKERKRTRDTRGEREREGTRPWKGAWVRHSKPER